MKYALNKCYGGFGVSKDVLYLLGIDRKCLYISNDDFGIDSEDPMAYRSDPRLVSAIEMLGTNRASQHGSAIEIVDVPDGTAVYWSDYDGIEYIHEVGRTW